MGREAPDPTCVQRALSSLRARRGALTPAAPSASSPGPPPVPALTRLCTPHPGCTLGRPHLLRGDLCWPAWPRELGSLRCSPDAGLSWSCCVCILRPAEPVPRLSVLGQLFLR